MSAKNDRRFLLVLMVIGAVAAFGVFADAISPGFDLPTWVVEVFSALAFVAIIAVYLLGRDHGWERRHRERRHHR